MQSKTKRLTTQFAFFLLSWIVASRSIGIANDIVASKRLIQGDYDKMNAAIAKKDMKTLFSYYSCDYRAIDASGNLINKEQSRKIFSQLCSHVTQITVRSRIKHIVQRNAFATVTVQSVMTMIVFIPRTRKTIKGTNRTEYLDDWVMLPKHCWILKANKVVSSSKPVFIFVPKPSKRI